MPRRALTLKLYPDHLCLYHQDKLIARHVRCYDRRQDFENPDHPQGPAPAAPPGQRPEAAAALLALTPKAEAFYQGLWRSGG